MLYVENKHCNKSYASFLINAIRSFFYKSVLKKIILAVSENNIVAIKCYKKNNFIQIEKRKNYYFIFKDVREDALIFQKEIYE